MDSVNALDDARRRSMNEIQTLKEKLQIEKEEWQEQIISKNEAEMKKRYVGFILALFL